MAKGQRGSSGIENDQNRERVARRAYERWEERGREDGRDQEDWFEAEREVEDGSSGQSTVPSAQSTQDRSRQRGGTDEAA
jgi:hypothetical protein